MFSHDLHRLFDIAGAHAVAEPGQNVRSDVQLVHTHKGRLTGLGHLGDQGQVFGAIQLVAIDEQAELTAPLAGERPFQHAVDRLILKVPVIGQIMHNSSIARFARTTAVTFKAGVPLVEALETVAGATGNLVYEKAVLRMRDDVSVGYPLNMAMKQTQLFPHMVVQMTAIGEEAGALDTMLFKVAEYFEQEVNNAVDALSSLLEPFIMVIIGVLVGGLVIGMYLPIFKIAATVVG